MYICQTLFVALDFVEAMLFSNIFKAVDMKFSVGHNATQVVYYDVISIPLAPHPPTNAPPEISFGRDYILSQHYLGLDTG